MADRNSALSVEDRRVLKTEAKTALQSTGMRRYQVLYLADGREKATPWMASEPRARALLARMKARYGEKGAALYVD